MLPAAPVPLTTVVTLVARKELMWYMDRDGDSDEVLVIR